MSGSLTNGLSNTTGTVVGSGSDAITLLMSGDAYGPSGAPGADAQFTLNVDGQQIGGLQDVSAAKSAGQDQTFTFLGNFAPGSHQVTVTFANNDGTQGDQTDFGRGGDRNVYVDGVAYNGQVVSNGTTPIYESPLFPPNGPYTPGNAVFAVDDTTSVPGDAQSTQTTTPSPVDIGSGSDTLNLSMAEDPFQGDAQFTVAVDGKQVGGTQTTTAVAWQGQNQQFNLHGDWGSGAHTVTVSFLNDAAGAFTGGLALDNVDRNLYITGVSYDGIEAGGTPWELASNGSQDFYVPAGGQPGNYVSSSTGSTSGGTAGSSTDNANGSTGIGTATTTSDNATVSGDALGSGSQSGSGSSGMSFIPPTGGASTSTGSTSGSTDTSGASNSGDTTQQGSGQQAGGTGATVTANDWTPPSPTGSATSDGSTSTPGRGGHGGWGHHGDWAGQGGGSGAAAGGWHHSHG